MDKTCLIDPHFSAEESLKTHVFLCVCQVSVCVVCVTLCVQTILSVDLWICVAVEADLADLTDDRPKYPSMHLPPSVTGSLFGCGLS